MEGLLSTGPTPSSFCYNPLLLFPHVQYCSCPLHHYPVSLQLITIPTQAQPVSPVQEEVPIPQERRGQGGLQEIRGWKGAWQGHWGQPGDHINHLENMEY